MADIKQTGSVPLVWPGQAIKPVGGTKRPPQRKKHSEQQNHNKPDDDRDDDETANKRDKGIDEYA